MSDFRQQQRGAVAMHPTNGLPAGGAPPDHLNATVAAAVPFRIAMPENDDRYVSRVALSSARVGSAAPRTARFSLSLRALAESPPAAAGARGRGLVEPDAVRFDTFALAGEAERFALESGGDVYERVLAVEGRWSGWNGYAVSALWELDDAEREEAFRRSRRLLFEARREHLRTFAFDWLLRMSPRKQEPVGAARYLVLGLYGDEEDLRQARSHPAVQRVAADHPPAAFGAVDLTGVRYFRVAAATRR